MKLSRPYSCRAEALADPFEFETSHDLSFHCAGGDVGDHRALDDGEHDDDGEYLDISGKRLLLDAFAADLLNVHAHVTDVMRIGWLAAEIGVPVTIGNTFLEIGVHMAVALPEVEWLEYSFQNFDHLVEPPIEIRDGYIYAPDHPGHGLVLSEDARRTWARPCRLQRSELGAAPHNPGMPVFG